MRQLSRIFCTAIAALCALAADATEVWTLQGKTYNVDTIFTAPIGPGTVQTSLRLSGSAKLELFYTVVDITNPYVDLRVSKAAGQVSGLATLSSQCKSSTTADARYFAGTNADFFGGGVPCGAVVRDGDPVYAVNNGWDSWYMTSTKQTGLGRVIFSGMATCAGASHKITSINGVRGDNALVIYTPRKGANTATNVWGTEVHIELIEGALGYRNAAKAKVVGEKSSAGGMTISDKQYVLSGNGTGSTFVAGLNDGDIIDLAFTSDFAQTGDITQMAGGLPVILKDGVVLETQGALDHLVANHPRTSIGYNADGTKVVMLVVDGRSGISVGCTSKVLADIMVNLGCTDALNFDGGGSSELYTTALGIRNNPSDGNERAVTNGVWAVSIAPADSEVAALRFKHYGVFSMPRYGYFTPEIMAYNKYGEIIDANFKGYTLSCPEELGVITDDGLTLLASGTGIHELTAACGSVKTKIMVNLGTAQPQFTVHNLLVDDYHSYKVQVGTEVEGSLMLVDNKALTWTSADESIATVDSEGVIRGVASGTTTIRGRVDGIDDTIEVTVEIPQTRYIPIYEPFSANTLTLSASGLNSGYCLADTPDGLAVSYSVKNTRSSYLDISGVKTLYSLPDAIRVVLSPNGCALKTMSVAGNLVGDKLAARNIDLSYDADAETVEFSIPMSDFGDVTDISKYPFAHTRLRFTFGDAASEDHTFYIKRIDGVYGHKEDNENSLPAVLSIVGDSFVISPNPVAPGASLNLYGTEIADIYNTNGQIVASTHASDAVAPSAPGVYIVRLSAGSCRLIVK